VRSDLVSKEQESIEHDVKKFIQHLIPELEQEFGLVCIGDGGSYGESISKITLTFNAFRRATTDEARQLYVRCTEKLLSAINNDINLRPYLVKYPFPVQGADISISFHNELDLPYSDGSVALIFQARGNICYYLDHPTHRLREPCFREPYDKAVEIVQAVPKTCVALRVHQAKPYEKALDVFWTTTAEAIHKKWKAAQVKFGGDMSDGIKEFAFLFYKYKKVDVSEARRLEIEVMEFLLEKINANTELRPYLKEYPVRPEHIQVLIEFKNSRGYDQEGEDRLFSVSHQNKVIQYCMRESSNQEVWRIHPIPVKTETYEEASQLLKGGNTKPKK
jgi:hypothetical protein